MIEILVFGGGLYFLVKLLTSGNSGPTMAVPPEILVQWRHHKKTHYIWGLIGTWGAVVLGLVVLFVVMATTRKCYDFGIAGYSSYCTDGDGATAGVAAIAVILVVLALGLILSWQANQRAKALELMYRPPMLGWGQPQQPAWGQPPVQPGWGQPQQPQQPGWGQPPVQPGWGQPQQPQQPGWGQPLQPGQPGWGQPQQPQQPGWGQPQQPGQPAWGQQQQPGQPAWGQPPVQPAAPAAPAPAAPAAPAPDEPASDAPTPTAE